MQDRDAWLRALKESSAALQGVLAAVLRAESLTSPQASPLERLQQIAADPQWVWLRPLYQLIADIDHVVAKHKDMPAAEAAVIGAQIKELLSTSEAPAQAEFLRQYRVLLQADPGVAMAHAAALRAIQGVPAEPADESERLHARHQWNERRRLMRAGNQPRQ
ncbi:MAG: hypothetical protein ACJ8R9_04035 [Steroidobacteraceae bacterium]